MSRIGRAPIPVPDGVNIEISGQHVTVKGPKGTLDRELHAEIGVARDGDALVVTRPSEAKMHKQLHGLTRTLVNNMVIGVTAGYRKPLEITGVGYRAAAQGKNLQLALGYSHEVVYPIPEGITVATPKPTEIVVSGTDKQKVGQVAAEIREYRPPEPYKGKGVKYAGEYVRRKEGKKK